MADTITYHMRRAGAADGLVTEKHYRFSRGDTIEAPAGEFDHLASGTYKTPSQGRYSLGEHAGGGWYSVLLDGEPTGETVGQGEEAAKEQIAEMNGGA